jgi:tellurite resistance protein TehA-like permease
MLAWRYITHPVLFKKNMTEFPASSFLGAIPISFNTIIQGIISYYDYYTSARWAVFALYWVALVMALFVSFGLVIYQMSHAKPQKLSDVAGIWVMTTVPLFLTASTAASILPFVYMESAKCAIALLVTGFMAWSFAIAEATMIITIYFFRLIADKTPQAPLMVGSFLPAAALSQGAFAIQKFSIFLATYIKSGYAPTQVNPPPLSQATLLATSEVIHWMGIIMNLFLLAHATFWVVQGTMSIFMSLPKLQFNIAYWSMVFPIASYANAWCFLSRDLRDDGMRGWAATMVMIATLLWLFCALETVYRGFWQGSLFSAPGLEDWLGDGEQEQDEKGRGGRKDAWNGSYTMPPPGSQDEESGQANGHESNEGDSRRRN